MYAIELKYLSHKDEELVLWSKEEIVWNFEMKVSYSKSFVSVYYLLLILSYDQVYLKV